MLLSGNHDGLGSGLAAGCVIFGVLLFDSYCVDLNAEQWCIMDGSKYVALSYTLTETVCTIAVVVYMPLGTKTAIYKERSNGNGSHNAKSLKPWHLLLHHTPVD